MLEAENWFSSSNPADDPDWIHYFDLAELHVEFAHCFRDLDKPELATQHAATSIEAEPLRAQPLVLPDGAGYVVPASQ